MKTIDKIRELEDWFDGEFKIPTTESRGEVYLAPKSSDVLWDMLGAFYNKGFYISRNEESIMAFGKKGRLLVDYKRSEGTNLSVLKTLDFLHKAVVGADADELQRGMELLEYCDFKRVTANKGFNMELEKDDKIYHSNLDWSGYYFKDSDKDEVVVCYHKDYKPKYDDIRKFLIDAKLFEPHIL